MREPLRPCKLAQSQVFGGHIITSNDQGGGRNVPRERESSLKPAVDLLDKRRPDYPSTLDSESTKEPTSGLQALKQRRSSFSATYYVQRKNQEVRNRAQQCLSIGITQEYPKEDDSFRLFDPA